MRVVVTGGGTGGHVFPALEIIKEIKRQKQQADVIFVGNPKSFEEKLAQKQGIPFFPLAAKKVAGQSLAKKIFALVTLFHSILRAIKFLHGYKPDTVIGVGGYVSAPMIMAGFLLGIDRYICEQNVVPGLANRILSFISQKIFISFDESKKYLPPKKCVLTGNPVREQFFDVAPAKDAIGPFRILVTGGSMGALFFNNNIPKAFGLLDHKIRRNLIVTHQTGNHLQDELIRTYKGHGIAAQTITFIDDMAKSFSDHHLLISRAGATVCAEILASGMPSVLIPYPYAKGHQLHNANALKQLQVCSVVTEHDDFLNRLAALVLRFYENRNLLERMHQNAKRQKRLNPATIIANIILESK